MSELVFLAATIKGGEDFSVWHLQHNVVWNDLLGLGKGDGGARRAVAFKLRRRLYDEIRELETLPHYRSARILGLCLYVMGLNPAKTGINKHYFALKKVVLRWTRENYLRLVRANPDVAAACLVGSVSYDSANRRLVKTYAKGLSLEAPKEYLELDAIVEPDEPKAAGGPNS